MAECNTCGGYLSIEDKIRLSMKCDANGNVVWQGALLNPIEYFDYLTRVTADGGTVVSEIDTAAVIRNIKSIYTLTNCKLLMLGQGGLKKRVSGIDEYLTKTYDASGSNNDGVQATESRQFILNKPVASNKTGFLNPNNKTLFLTFPTITFAEGAEWTVSFMLNWNLSNNASTIIIGEGFGIYLNYVGVYKFHFRDATSSKPFANVTSTEIIGKTTLVTFTMSSSKVCSLYINGVLRDTLTASYTTLKFIHLCAFIGFTGFKGDTYGKYYYLRLQQELSTPAQILREYNALRSIFPEIETVSIDGKNVASSNLDIVHRGGTTLLADATADATWQTGAAGWSYHTGDIGARGKLYNKAARDLIIANPLNGYHIATEAELTSMALLGGNQLKTAMGLDSLIASRNADGSFNPYDETASFWCADSDKVLKLHKLTDVAEIVSATANEGHAIRLIKDYPFNNGKLVITFDDGYNSLFTTAYPILTEQNIPATIYLIGTRNSNYITWAQAKEMSDAGIDIQCHTNTHADLTLLTQGQVVAELQAVNDLFAANSLPVPTHIAYPFGNVNENVRSYVSGLRTTGRNTGVISNFTPITKQTLPYSLPAIAIDNISDVDLTTLLSQMSNCQSSKNAIIVYAHGVSTNGAAYEIATAKFRAIINHAKSIGMDIETISQLKSQMI